MVGRGGFEPPKSKTSDLQSDPFGRSGICPYYLICCGAGDWTRTHNLLITNQLLCQLSYTGVAQRQSYYKKCCPFRTPLFVVAVSCASARASMTTNFTFSLANYFRHLARTTANTVFLASPKLLQKVLSF